MASRVPLSLELVCGSLTVKRFPQFPDASASKRGGGKSGEESGEEQRGSRGVRANGAMNHPVTQAVSSLLSSLIGARRVQQPLGWLSPTALVRSKACFRVRDSLPGEFPGAARLARAARSRDIGLVTTSISGVSCPLGGHREGMMRVDSFVAARFAART